MKFKSVFLPVLLISFIACAQETPKVKQRSKMQPTAINSKKVKVVNLEDPICHMKTDGESAITAVYNKKTFGFCSSYCKDEFVKDPKKYVK